MPTFSTYNALPAFDQLLHSFHFMLCSFALLIACVPMLTEKGSTEHKAGGLIYVPVSMAALLLGCWMAWVESSLVFFSFNCFCAYLLMSGWRAAHSEKAPQFLDWSIPGSLFAVALLVTWQATQQSQDMRGFYLMFFAMNAFYLSWRDFKHLQGRIQFHRYKLFMPSFVEKEMQPAAWLGRHIAGMVGSVIANLSVIVLTLLPLSLHWLWPVTLVTIGGYIAYKERQKKLRVRRAMATILQPKFRPRIVRADDDWRKAA